VRIQINDISRLVPIGVKGINKEVGNTLAKSTHITPEQPINNQKATKVSTSSHL